MLHTWRDAKVHSPARKTLCIPGQDHDKAVVKVNGYLQDWREQGLRL